MSASRRLITATSLLFVALVSFAPLRADDGYGHSPRQYYGAWQHHPQTNYFYRSYYFKPHAGYSGYRHHYVILFSDRPRHCYFYNPYAKRYWGRCSTFHDGKPEYSHLAEVDQRGTIADIQESAFPQPGALPAIPESKDGAKLDLPPDDLPQDFRAP